MKLVPGSSARLVDHYDSRDGMVLLGRIDDLHLVIDLPAQHAMSAVKKGTPTMVVSTAVQRCSGLPVVIFVAGGEAALSWVYLDELRGVEHGHAGGRVLHEERTVVHRPP
jgi:hypothetical protein